MSYIGNQPLQGSYDTIVDPFVGDGTTVNFTLSQIPPSKESIIVTIDGVTQHISTYSVASTILTFTIAPGNSADIQVLFIGINI